MSTSAIIRIGAQKDSSAAYDTGTSSTIRSGPLRIVDGSRASRSAFFASVHLGFRVLGFRAVGV